jgi:hypothetical protein
VELQLLKFRIITLTTTFFNTASSVAPQILLCLMMLHGIGSVATTEAKDRRELAQLCVLPCLVGGEGWEDDELYCDGRLYRLLYVLYHLPCQSAAQLRASGEPSCCRLQLLVYY